MPECGVCYEDYNNLKTLYSCDHQVCKSCYPKIIDSFTRRGVDPCCPFCRTLIKEISLEYEVEFWLNLEPSIWEVTSTTTNNGTEIIKTHKKNETPSWRNNDNVIIIKQHKRRKKYIRNKNK